jgi:hypothetical protein
VKRSSSMRGRPEEDEWRTNVPGETQIDSPPALRGDRAGANVLALRDQALRTQRPDSCMLRIKGKPHPPGDLLPLGIDSPVELRLDSLPLVGGLPDGCCANAKGSLHTG